MMRRAYSKISRWRNLLDLSRRTVQLRDMSDDTPDSLIPYDDIVQEALRTVVGRVLGKINSNEDLLGAHHFYITFKTGIPGVSIPRNLMERFPDEMTIVLQNKFWDLIVDDIGFQVRLTFGQVPTLLVIPFAALTAFVDPAVEFALHFHVNAESDGQPDHANAVNDAPIAVPVEDGSNVVAVDFGRKK
jgi:uncharacterized protein